jgi:ech hydrogenase subunit D
MREPQVYEDIELESLIELARAYEQDGWRFVNMNGSTVEGGVELLYSFAKEPRLENLKVVVDTEQEVPSITPFFPNVFVFENETHDLYGVNISGISIDFKGKFYAVSVPTPMNPHSTQAKEAVQEHVSDTASGEGDEQASTASVKEEDRG